MTDYYVSSVDGANGTPASVTWWNGTQDTYASLSGIIGAIGSGTHRIFVDSAHVHSYSGNPILQNTTALSILIISVDRSTGAFLAGAEENMGANVAQFTLNGSSNGVMLFMGINFYGSTANSSSSDLTVANASGRGLVFIDCELGVLSSNSGALFLISNLSGGRTHFFRCNILMPDRTGDGITLGGQAYFKQCTFEFQATSPTNVFRNNSQQSSTYLFEGCDFSTFSGTYIVAFTTSTLDSVWRFVNCKKHASSDWLDSTAAPIYGIFEIINCDDGDTRTVYELYRSEGALVQSTSVYMTGGAELVYASGDTVPVSWQLVTNSNCSEYRPFIVPDIRRLIDSTASQTFRVEIVHDSATDLTDTEVWLEASYVDDASFPLGTIASSVGANYGVGTGTDLPASSESWTGTGGFTNENKQKVEITGITPAEKSMGRFGLFVGKASTTIYINPQVLA